MVPPGVPCCTRSLSCLGMPSFNQSGCRAPPGNLSGRSSRLRAWSSSAASAGPWPQISCQFFNVWQASDLSLYHLLVWQFLSPKRRVQPSCFCWPMVPDLMSFNVWQASVLSLYQLLVWQALPSKNRFSSAAAAAAHGPRSHVASEVPCRLLTYSCTNCLPGRFSHERIASSLAAASTLCC